MTKLEFNDNDIARAWQKLVDEKFSNSLIKKEEIMTAIKMESHSNIAELKRRLKYKLYWSAGFTIAFGLILLFFLSNIDMVLLLGIVTAAYLIGFILMYIKYKKIADTPIEAGDILSSLKYNVKLIKSILQLEKAWGMIIFMPAIVVGILGGRVLNGHTLTESFQDPKILTIVIIASLVVTPLLVWSSHKMNKFAFGDYLKTLENNIVKMETLQ